MQTIFINCNINDNTSLWNGPYELGAIECIGNSNPIILNSILWNNYPILVRFSSVSAQCTLTVSYTDFEGGLDAIETNDNGEVFWLEGNIDADPLFVDPENVDYHLTANSPCIDAGDPNSPLDPDGTITDMGAFYFDQSIGIDDENIQYSIENIKLSVYPNPFHSLTTISFSNEQNQQNEQRKIEIYNIKGQKVKSLECVNSFDAKATKSLSRITWNGTDESNKPVSSGIYFINLQSGNKNLIKKAILMR